MLRGLRRSIFPPSGKEERVAFCRANYKGPNFRSTKMGLSPSEVHGAEFAATDRKVVDVFTGVGT